MKTTFVSIVLTAILLAFASCGSKTDEKAPAAEEEHHEEEGRVELTEVQFKSANIGFGKIEARNMSGTIAVNGVLDVPPQNMVSVSAVMGGFIKSTELLQGMEVKKGEVIATIQNPDFIQIQSQYLENKQKILFLEQEFKRQEELSRENVSAAKVFQQVSSEFHTMEATQGALEERLKILSINPKTLTQSNIRSTVNIVAPISGFVTTVNVNLGKFVQPQDVICEIVDTDHLHAELTVFEKDISKLKKGQKIRFQLVNESNKERTASIFLINHLISAERTIRVHAHLDKEDHSLMPNMYLKALIETGSEKVNTLPEAAIVQAEGKDFIFIKAEPDKHEKHEGEEKEHEEHGEEFAFQAIEVKKGLVQNGFAEVHLPIDFEILKAEVVINGAYTILAKRDNAEGEGHAH
ncbi:MAG TPA: efflux RND transporter periplasmic adaptor subunit [Catalimonadaceae bacterium]|nr:efflux RND transporter periplasmic adaptor subunit [Catalimonadaceae bacterium]